MKIGCKMTFQNKDSASRLATVSVKTDKHYFYSGRNRNHRCHRGSTWEYSVAQPEPISGFVNPSLMIKISPDLYLSSQSFGSDFDYTFGSPPPVVSFISTIMSFF